MARKLKIITNVELPTAMISDMVLRIGIRKNTEKEFIVRVVQGYHCLRHI